MKKSGETTVLETGTPDQQQQQQQEQGQQTGPACKTGRYGEKQQLGRQRQQRGLDDSESPAGYDICTCMHSRVLRPVSLRLAAGTTLSGGDSRVKQVGTGRKTGGWIGGDWQI